MQEQEIQTTKVVGGAKSKEPFGIETEPDIAWGNDAPKKIIVVLACETCPYYGECEVWNKLTPWQRTVLALGNNLGKFILKGCPLQDENQYNQNKKRGNNANS